MAAQTLQSRHEHKLPVVDDDTDQRTERVQRAQWLRAAILGANDGLLSTTSLMLGIGAIRHDRWSMVLSGLAGALAGACSMAVGEFVSVSMQRDIEEATVSQCTAKSKLCKQDDKVIKLDVVASPPPTVVETMPAQINTPLSPAVTPSKGTPCAKLTSEPAEKVSPTMTPGKKLPFGSSPGRYPITKVIMEDAKANTMKGEENNIIGKETLPSPYKAAAASALAFLCGSFVPIASAMFAAHNTVRTVVIVVVASLALALFGGVGAQLGGAPIRVSAVRVLVGGWVAMAITYGLLKPFEKEE